MITWSVCVAARNGSALSIYSLAEEPMPSPNDAPTQEDVCISCADYAEEAASRSIVLAPQSSDPQETDPTWDVCDFDGIDVPKTPATQRKV
jgi:hypothetical protein